MWDDRMKRLFAAIPQDLVSWLMPGAIFLESVSLELKTVTRTIHSDILLKIRVDGEIALLHVEIQKRIEALMPKRVWEYNVAATLTHDCPAYSFVIYLMPDGNREVPRAPMTWGLPQRGRVHTFEFSNIELWTRSVEALWEPGLLGILPLSLLAADGMRREVCEAICKRVKGNSDLLSLTLTVQWCLRARPICSGSEGRWVCSKILSAITGSISTSWSKGWRRCD